MERELDLAPLKKGMLFRNMTDEEILQTIAAMSPHRAKYPRRTVVAQDGDLFPDIGIILSGNLRLAHVDSNGNNNLLYVLQAGDTVGEVNAVGRYRLHLSITTEEPAEIVGVVRDFNFKPLQYGVDPLALYVFGSDPWWPLSVVYVRIDGTDVAGTFRDIRDAIEEFDPSLNGDEIMISFLDESIGSLYEKERTLNRLIATAAALSLAISLIGILGMVSFETRFRRKEIALRKVHGADTTEILRMQNRHYMLMTAICFAISVPLSLPVMEAWVRGFAYRAPIPVWIFLVSLLSVAAITVLTVTLQSLGAARANPVDSLHDE